MTTPPKSEKTTRKKESIVIRLLRSFFYFLLELFIPVVISLGLVYIFGSLVNFGTIEPEIIAYIFGAALVVFSLLISTSLDRFTYLLRGTVLPEEEDTKKARRKKAIKIILSGFLLPLGVALAAVLVRTDLTGETYMEMLVQAVVRHGETTVVVDIGSTVAASDSYETKIQGIKTLSTIHTPEALDQLLYIIENDPSALQNQSLYQTLSASIASYGTDGQKKLFDIYNKAVKEEEEGPGGMVLLQDDFYTRYFADAFSALQKELDGQTTGPQEQRAQRLLMEQAQAQLKTTLNEIHPALVTGRRQDILLAFLMDTTIAMNTQQDEQLYPLVKQIASDPAQPEVLRGKAIVLLGRLGSQADFNLLYTWMNDPSEYIRAKTLFAVDQLFRKVNNLPLEKAN